MRKKMLIAVSAVLLFSVAAQAQKKELPVPPAEHPRLYLRSSDIPALKARMETEAGKKILKRLRKLSVPRSEEEEAEATDRGFRYYFQMRGKTSEVQLLALDYLVNKNARSADRAVKTMLDTLERTSFGTKKDLSRASGVMLMVGAMVYDWCYDRLSPEIRSRYIKEFIRIAGTMECHYPPKRTESVAGHGSEWMVLRDMLSAGIAVYDEYPDMYNYVISMLYQDYVPVRNYIYSGRNYHQGSSYVNVRFSNDLIANWIITRMGAEPLFSADQRYVAYDLIYRTRPDNLVLPSGDTNPSRRGFVHNYALLEMLASSYYHDPYIAYQYEKKPKMENHCLMLELLWRDFDLKGKAPDDLPLTNYSPSPFAWMIARTGWDAGSVIAEMKVNEQFVGNHQHLDGGAFQIYYKGPLAIDSGTYQGSSGGYNSPHCKNYFKRTIAHNSLLVYDPDEVFECWNYGGGDKTATAANDGGQRMPGDKWDTCRSFADLMSDSYTVGKECAHWIDGGYSYLKGDITKAYSSKVKDVKRSFLFVNTGDAAVPAVMVVCDHVTSSNPAFRKYFLLHSIEEPEISGNEYYIRRSLNGDSGMLYCSCLLPAAASIEKVGGPGKEFWVFGTNYPNNRKDEANERGAWRIEISPSSPNTEDIFLNVIQVGDNGGDRYCKVLKYENPSVVGAVLSGRAVLFSRSGNELRSDFEFVLPKGAKREIVLTDMGPGKWTVTGPDRVAREYEAAEGEGVVKISSSKPGKYFVRHKN